MQRIPRLLRFTIPLVLIYTAAFSLARLLFWLRFDNPNDPLPGNDLLHALYLGLKFDLRMALLMVLPLLLLGGWRWFSPFTSVLLRRIWLGYLLLVTTAVTLLYVTDFGHFAYLNTRIDISIMRFLANPLISLQMVWESYAVIPWTIGLLLFFTLAGLGLNRLLTRYGTIAPDPTLRGWHKTVVVTVTFFIVLFGLYGKVSAYPLRWSDAFFSNHNFAPSLALNPLIYLYETYKIGLSAPYDEEAVRSHYPQLSDYLGVTQPDAEKLNFLRAVKPAYQRDKPYNVVVVILESFAAYKSGLSGNPLKPTPNFDALAADGLYYRNFYTPTTGTARSMFAALTGLPDVLVGSETSSRNPRMVEQQVVMDQFDGYDRHYFLGGSANWANIRGMLANNVRGLQIHEEGSYESPVIDVWGISDLDLFREAHKVLQHQQKPFVAVIQTSGNHRPYTIPEDNAGFELRSATPEILAKHGFESEEEFNSYRFMDHSIGWFIDAVKEAGYFDNTIFAFFGDHGITGNAGVHALKADTVLGLGSNRVPFVIYAPTLISEGRVLDTVVSEVDVMTSLASLAGQPHINTTLGRDIFNPAFDNNRHAFIIAHGANTTIGVVNQEFYFRMPLKGDSNSLHRLHSESPREDLAKQYPQQAQQMEQMTRSLYESARYLSNNNLHVENAQALAQHSNSEATQ